MDQVRVRALRGVTEWVRGRGMVVLNAPRAADKEKGISARKGGEDELPVEIAQQLVDRGAVEVVGAGAKLIDKKKPGFRRERRLEAREMRRQRRDADGAGVGLVDEDDVDGEPSTATESYREKLEAADPQPGDGATDVNADGVTTQVPSGTTTGTAEDVDGEASTETRDLVGDGASAIVGGAAIEAKAEGETAPATTARKRGRPATKGGTTAVPSDAPAD